MQTVDYRKLRLTETVTKGGCAAKLPAGSLKTVLQNLRLKRPTELFVGAEKMDDAALWDIGDGRFLIQTLDFFTPIVDDIKDFGAIAAANSISDVYAMGGTPKIALSILAFPGSQLDLGLISPLMEGAVEKIHEAGACLAGGHTIDDDTLKFGFSVTGFVEKNRAWTNSGALPGDVLILTKGLGTGTITSALKNQKAKEEWVAGAIDSMKTLNKAPELLASAGISVNAATDITGFGLAGHTLQMAEASQVQILIQSVQLPVLSGAMECLEQKILNRAHRTNGEYVSGRVSFSKIADPVRNLCLDAQTSGGLLLSVSEPFAQEVVKVLRAHFPLTRKIGRVYPIPNGLSGESTSEPLLKII